ncbi:hypothetical protein [Agromyces sp. ZXT2-6]|uniref:hypothetical protein n=1 Tax=Agromyces sp. ZXT2-6 TaxID=3461153 RepID=UPI0040550360
MTDEREPGETGPVEAWDDEGGAAEPDEVPEKAPDVAPDDEAQDRVDRSKRWSDERTGHWHGAGSSDVPAGRADEE